MRKLFVTGAPRTGTTLLDKLLSMHPRVTVHSQPLPLLYVRLKACYLEQSGHPLADDPYPLSDVFLANYYPPWEFAAFLRSTPIDPALCAEVLEEMVDYQGQYTRLREREVFLKHYSARSLHECFSSYCAALSARDAEVIGAKESFCEEFIPYFLLHDVDVVQTIRDPRDSIASLSHGDAAAHSGSPRPLLFNVRQWRKSAAFALAHAGHRGFRLLRYEDLVSQPTEHVNQILLDVAVEPFGGGALETELRAPEGHVWRSNSSHRPTSRVSRRSVGSHWRLLSGEVRRFIEATCYYEMRALGYEPELRPEDIHGAIAQHTDETPLHRPYLASYRWSAERAREEHRRIDAIQRGVYDPRMFIFHETFAAIRRAADGPR